jgi:starch synthase
MTCRVLFITSEIDDFVRVGGLAAVSAALPRALQPFVDVRVMLPGYTEVLAKLPGVEIVGHCPARAELPECQLGRAITTDGLPVYVLICPQLYERHGTPYGNDEGQDWPDNDLRFATLAASAARLAEGRLDPDWRADLVHANDWQSALVPAYLAWNGCTVPTILTIHNLAFQGLFGKDTLRRIGAPESSFHIEGLEFYGKVSFLKAGLIYATHLTTVSETYAREITSREFGCGLEGILSKRSQAKELTGIINGIDDTWDSRTCPELAMPFQSGDWKSKRANADHLRREFGLALSRGPLFALVARLVHQKGVDLVLSAAETIIDAGGQLVVMGRGEPQFEHELQIMQERHPASIGVLLRFDPGQSRRIFAGSDFTLMPSRFEPCGLSQMYAQRLASLPIGRKTGGLAETIKDGQTGFLFAEPSAASLLGAVCRAFQTFGHKRHLNLMRLEAMAQPFEWSLPAGAYRSLYGTLTAA